MHTPIPNLPPTLRLKNPRHIHPPSKNLRTQPQPVSLHSLLRHNLLILPQLLEIRILRPGIIRQEICQLGDVLEAGVDEPVFHVILNVVRLATCGGGLDECAEVLVKGGVIGACAIVAVGPEGAFVDFEVAAWFEGGVAAAEELGSVCDATGGGVSMDLVDGS